MRKYMAPLGVFVGGQLLLLIVFLFLSTIGSVADTMATEAASASTWAWGFDWWSDSSVVKMLVVVIVEILTLWAATKAFLGIKR